MELVHDAARLALMNLLLHDIQGPLEMNFTPKELEVYRLLPGDILLSEASAPRTDPRGPLLWR